MVDEKQSKVCIYCGKKVSITAKWCNYCGKKLEEVFEEINTRNVQTDSLNQENSDFNNNNHNNNNYNHNNHNNLIETGEYEKYIIRLQKNLPNPELIDLPSFKEVNFYRENDIFAYVKYIPNITVDIATKYINESINSTHENFGVAGAAWAPLTVQIIVSENVNSDVIGFILRSNKMRWGITKNAIIMNAIHDLSNHSLYYKKRTAFIGFLRNSSINKFLEKFNV